MRLSMNDELNLCLSGRVFEISYSENALSLEEFFTVAANNRFKTVELRNSQISIDCSEEAVDKINILSEQYGISVALITARKGRLDTEEGYGIYKKYLDLAARINCQQIKISGGNISLVRKAASDAEKFNIKIGTNNHIGTPLATVKGTLDRFDEIKHSNVYLLFDPTHLWLSGESLIEDFIEEMIERISFTIIQDYVESEAGNLCGTRRVLPVSIGEKGFVGYEQFIRKLTFLGFRGPFSLVYLKNGMNLENNDIKLRHHLLNYFNSDSKE